MIPLPFAVPWRLLAAGGVAAACFGGGWTVQGWRADGKIADLQQAHAQAVQDAQAEAARLTAQAAIVSAELAKQAEETIDALQLLQKDRDRAHAGFAAASGRLRDAYARGAGGRCPDPGNPADVAAAESADVVRADVFQRAVERATELAGAVDEQHAYSRACAARYRQVAEALRAAR